MSANNGEFDAELGINAGKLGSFEGKISISNDRFAVAVDGDIGLIDAAGQLTVDSVEGEGDGKVSLSIGKRVGMRLIEHSCQER